MNLRQLEAFQAIMTSGSTIAAGEQLGLSQSAISRMLAQLEEDLGLRLFARQKGRLVPTPEAEALLPDAQRVVESALGFRRHSEQLRLGGFQRKLLKVAVPNTLASEMMPALVRQFMAERPDVVLEVLSTSYGEAARAVVGRDVDLAMVQLPADIPGLALLATLETDIVCVLPEGHRLATRESLGPADLEAEPLVFLGRQRQLRHEIDQAFRQARVLPRVAAEVHSVGVACSFVAAGLGLALVNGLIASYCDRLPLVLRPFRPCIGTQLGLAALEGTGSGSLCTAFAQRMMEAVRERAAGHTRVLA
ncbi:LysR family transcriptional regulator [Ramlibacter sp. G-1-2-2]|uniref:LysR family transcriptional regulator n=1 Tax=Ramlibacter agri TaxID=2728837 RepID=A0A848GXL7_9BURK|nr:LysR family transcriptional regulator [Ramlibacter agri]NML42171.1 LysR family transcriptional regulator [Ramlibacter agri]